MRPVPPQRILDAVGWREDYPFMGRMGRKRWKRYVHYHRRDRAGRPVLFVDFDRASHEVPPSATSELVRAILSQVEYGVNTKLGDGAHRSEQLCVVVKCTETSILKANRILSILRPTVQALQRAYPERLGELFLVGMPGVIGAVVGMVKRLLPTRTQATTAQLPCCVTRPWREARLTPAHVSRPQSKLYLVNQFDPRLPPLPGVGPGPKRHPATPGTPGDRDRAVQTAASMPMRPRGSIAAAGPSMRAALVPGVEARGGQRSERPDTQAGLKAMRRCKR